jgi:hypothetical protein
VPVHARDHIAPQSDTGKREITRVSAARLTFDEELSLVTTG